LQREHDIHILLEPGAVKIGRQMGDDQVIGCVCRDDSIICSTHAKGAVAAVR